MLKLKATPKTVSFKKRDNCAKKKIRKLVKYLRSELESSTTHGLPYVVNTELHWSERIFWLASFALSAIMICMLLSAQYRRFVRPLSGLKSLSTSELGNEEDEFSLTKLFQGAPLVMSVEMDYFNWNVSYPAIYLCPFDRADDLLLNSLINDTSRTAGQDLGQYIETIATATLDGVHLVQVPEPEILSLINASDYATIAANAYRKIANASVSSVGPWTVDFDTCMTEMGMCDVINSNVASVDNPLKWSDEITFTRNNVELSFHDRDFFVQLMNYADSYKIYVQSPNDLIQIGMPASTFDEQGFLSFGVQMSSTTASEDVRSLPLYLRKCRFADEPNSPRYPVYSYNRCLVECRIRMIVKLCGCVPHFYKPLEYEKVCDLAELKCVENYLKEILLITISNETITKFATWDLPRNPRECGCLDNCEYTSYRKADEVFLPQDMMNRLRINVASFPKVRVSREIIFGFYDMFLRSGGVINLCIGASVISVMELILTILRIPMYVLLQILRCILTMKQIAKAACKDKKEK